jgi:hypothetical protein
MKETTKKHFEDLDRLRASREQSAMLTASEPTVNTKSIGNTSAGAVISNENEYS